MTTDGGTGAAEPEEGGAERSRQPSEADFLAGLGQRVRRMRAIHGMSRKVLSRASGVSERYIAQLEGGDGNVSVLLLRRLAAAMGVEIEDLVSGGDSAGDWRVFRDLLRAAAPAQTERAKQVLSGASVDQRRAGGRPHPERVALIGLRGAGKSTLGRLAAERLGWRFVELNTEIERKNGLSVPEIFNLYGQGGYRRLEQAAIRGLIARPGAMVLATGGGIVAEPLTFDLVLSSFFTVWLRARPEEHMARVRRQGDLRPMADDRSAMQELRTILLSREPLYARAGAIVDTSGLTVDAAAERLIAAIALNADAAPAVIAADRRGAARRRP